MKQSYKEQGMLFTMQRKTEPTWTQRAKLLKLLAEKNLTGQSGLKIVEPMKGKSEEEKERIAERLIHEVEKM